MKQMSGKRWEQDFVEESECIVANKLKISTKIGKGEKIFKPEERLKTEILDRSFQWIIGWHFLGV